MTWLSSRQDSIKNTKAGLARSLSYKKTRLTSRFHRLAWITSVKAIRLTLKVHQKLLLTKTFHYSRVSLKDLYVEDYDLDREVRIPLKWDSGAQEVVRLPREARKFTIRVFRAPRQWPWGGGKP